VSETSHDGTPATNAPMVRPFRHPVNAADRP
jgi:hypothetical protein